MVLPPLVRLTLASPSASVNVYPVALLVLTVTVSLALLTTPLAVGVSESATVDVDVMPIDAPTDALTTVFAVVDAADAMTGEQMTPTTISAVAARCVVREVRVFMCGALFVFVVVCSSIIACCQSLVKHRIVLCSNFYYVVSVTAGCVQCNICCSIYCTIWLQ